VWPPVPVHLGVDLVAEQSVVGVEAEQPVVGDERRDGGETRDHEPPPRVVVAGSGFAFRSHQRRTYAQHPVTGAL